jgi:hypothetical protein
MTQLVITLKDQSNLPNIRRILKSLVGVEKVTTAKTGAKPAARKNRPSVTLLMLNYFGAF